MTTSPAPDVDRVLDRMGRSTIGYRSFPHPDDAFAAPPERVAEAPDRRDAASVTAMFGLVGDALPAASHGDAAAAPTAQVNPFLPPPAKAAAPSPQMPTPPARPVRLASLTEMFRILSGDAARTPSRGDAARQETVFPFRRR